MSEVLWGERIGLLPEDDRWFTVYFAQLPMARFDSQHCELTRFAHAGVDYNRRMQGKGTRPLPLHPYPVTLKDQKVSGMCPV